MQSAALITRRRTKEFSLTGVGSGPVYRYQLNKYDLSQGQTEELRNSNNEHLATTPKPVSGSL